MSDLLRFCMVTTFYPPENFGGDGIFVQRLSRELAGRGHHVEVVHCADAHRALAPRGAPSGPVVGEADSAITVHRLSSRFGRLSPLLTQQTGRPLLKAARIRAILERGFDVIHFHNVSLVGGPAVLAYGDAVKLYTLHEFWLICPTHGLFRFNREVCTTRTCVRCQIVYRRPPQFWRNTGLMDRAIAHVDAFIAPDRHTMERHRERFPDLPLVHLPHFVPEIDIVPEDPADPPYFLFVGRLEVLKGLQTLIPLFRDGGVRAELRVAGEGRHEEELRALAAGSARIRFLGRVEGEPLQRLYRDAIAVLVPSINYEVAPPLVILEGFRQRTPALVRNLGSMPEIIAESGGGWVYDDERELRAKLDRLCDDRAHREELGMRGHRAWRRRWTADAHLDGYFAVIREAAERRRRRLDPSPEEVAGSCPQGEGDRRIAGWTR